MAVKMERELVGLVVDYSVWIGCMGDGQEEKSWTLKKRCGRPPQYALPLSSPMGAEAPRMAEKTT